MIGLFPADASIHYLCCLYVGRIVSSSMFVRRNNSRNELASSFNI